MLLSAVGKLDLQQWLWSDPPWLENTHIFDPRHNLSPMTMAIQFMDHWRDEEKVLKGFHSNIWLVFSWKTNIFILSVPSGSSILISSCHLPYRIIPFKTLIIWPSFRYHPWIPIKLCVSSLSSHAQWKTRCLEFFPARVFLFPFAFVASPERAMKLLQSKCETNLTQEQLFSSSVNQLEDIHHEDIVWVEGGIVTL